MKDVLCSDVIKGFRSGSGPQLAESETPTVLPSNKSACAEICGSRGYLVVMALVSRFGGVFLVFRFLSQKVQESD